MPFPSKKCFLGISIVYGIILGGLLYWHFCPGLDKHLANPRYYLVFQKARGQILDRNGELLAFSKPQGETYVRTYATASLAHTVGYFHQRYGMAGLERVYHEDLTKGRQLCTTIDLGIQRLLEEALVGKTGGVVAIDPQNGEILGLVSAPFIDGNALTENWADYQQDLRSPFLNRVTHGLYPPGSVVKPLVYAAALECGLAQPQQVWNDLGSVLIQGQRIQNYAGQALGSISSDQALALSSNVVFAQLAAALGPDLLAYYRKFGLGQNSALELSQAAGFLPSQVRSASEGALLGIGQGKLTTTPLQIALMGVAIANRGTFMEPFLVREIRGGLQMRQITRPLARGHVIPEQIAVIVRDAMVLTVEKGTAGQAKRDQLLLAAKTGTAETGRGRDHSWFLGFAPAADPRVVVAIVIEHGGPGSSVATPLGGQILGDALEILNAQKGKR